MRKEGALPRDARNLSTQICQGLSTLRLTLPPVRAGDATMARLLANEYGPLVKVVPTYWHVMKSGESYDQGNLQYDMLTRQMTVLNRMFNKANIQFKVSPLSGLCVSILVLFPRSALSGRADKGMCRF